MDDTALDIRLEIHTDNDLREPFQPIDTDNQYILQPPVLQVAQNLQLEVGSLTLRDARAQYLFVAIAVDP